MRHKAKVFIKSAITVALAFVLIFNSTWMLTSEAAQGELWPSQTIPTISKEVPTLPALNCKSAVLMEAKTGEVLYEQNATEALPPASVTKIMTLLLVMEAIERGTLSLDEMVTVSEHAASMGGSQVYLEAGETISVDDLVKSVVISSANDAAVALAEVVSGNEEAFVELMNKRAAELSMHNTVFENTNGLDDTSVSHLTSALDIAKMSRELIKYEKILEYSTTWMDSIRDGEFELTNTNRLVRYYSGATGLKTGSTSKALFCISATAMRDGMHLIAVIMGAPSREERNKEAAYLLDWGFANFSLFNYNEAQQADIRVVGSEIKHIKTESLAFAKVVPKGSEKRVECRIIMPNQVTAPVSTDTAVGKIEFILDGETIGISKIISQDTASRIRFKQILLLVFKKYCLL